MQTKRIQKPSTLKGLDQGHIFQIKTLKLLDGSVEKGFSDFYPRIDLSKIEKGIVISQSCDLEHKKVPYITVGLLEPFSKVPTWMFRDTYFESQGTKYDKFGFWNSESIVKFMSRQLKLLIQNNDAANFFVTLKGKNNRYFYVNLTKLFPIRIEHYDAILKKVTHRTGDGFKQLIGWKMANLYGRVGVDNYTENQVKNIATRLADEMKANFIQLEKSKSDLDKVFEIDDDEAFKKVKSKVNSLNKAKSAERRKNLEKDIIDIIQSL